MLTLQTKNKITVIRETDQIAQMPFCFPTGAYLLKAVRPPPSNKFPFSCLTAQLPLFLCTHLTLTKDTVVHFLKMLPYFFNDEKHKNKIKAKKCLLYT